MKMIPSEWFKAMRYWAIGLGVVGFAGLIFTIGGWALFWLLVLMTSNNIQTKVSTAELIEELDSL